MKLGYWLALPETAWCPDINGVGSGGDTGADIQRGDSYSVAFTRPDQPCARVTFTFYAAEYDSCPGEFVVQRQVEFLVGAVPSDLASTEIWSCVDYDNLTFDGLVIDTEEAARAQARQFALAAAETGDDINWDGQPMWGE